MPSRTITDTATELFPQNALRKSFAVENEDSTVQIYLKKEKPGGTTVSATDHDHNLRPASTITLNYDTDGREAIKERWTIIAASGTPRISFIETEEIER